LTLPWNIRERETTPHNLNNSLLFFRYVSLFSSFFLAIGKGGGGTVGDPAGRCELSRSDHTRFIALWCNNRGGKAARLRRHGKKA
jgi:hypothetical protein